MQAGDTTPEQAYSTARLSGSVVSLMDTITAPYSRYCGFPLAPLQSIGLSGAEYAPLPVTSAEHYVGVIARNDGTNFDALKREMVRRRHPQSCPSATIDSRPGRLRGPLTNGGPSDPAE